MLAAYFSELHRRAKNGGNGYEIAVDSEIHPRVCICMIAFSGSNGPALLESLEVQCRAAMRAEWKGPNCRMNLVPNPESGPCNMTVHNDIPFFDNKVVECVKRGGPGRKSARNAE